MTTKHFNELTLTINFLCSHHIPVRLESSPKAQLQRLQYCTWLGYTNALLIIFQNDIYLRHSPVEEGDIRLTFTGQPEIIFNGVPDWLYQGKNNIFLSLSFISVISSFYFLKLKTVKQFVDLKLDKQKKLDHSKINKNNLLDEIKELLKVAKAIPDITQTQFSSNT